MEREAKGERASGRRPYRAPELVEYGSVASRTLGTTMGSFPDAMGGRTMTPPMCY